MKKALVILLAIFMVGAAFAEDVVAPTFSGAATLTWGYDLQTGGSGFANASSDVTVTWPFASKGSNTKGGDGMYGEISVSNFGFKLVQQNDEVPEFTDIDSDNGWSVSAKIVLSPNFNVGVYSKPSTEIKYAEKVGGGAAVDVTVADASSNGGTSLNYTSDMADFSALFVSQGAPTNGTSNEYAAKAWLKVKPAALFNAEAAFVYNKGFASANAAMDAGVKAVVTYDPFTLTLASDMNVAPNFNYDFRADADVVIVKDVATLNLDYFADEGFANMNAAVALSGKVSIVSYGAKVTLDDITTNLTWKFAGKLSVTPVEDVTFAANFSYAGTNGAYDLVYDTDNSAISLALGPKFHTVDNTTFTFKYAALAGNNSGVTDKGEFTIAAKIAF